MAAYIGRFAPSPTGPLHMGSLVAAMASWLDAQAHSGRWLVRIEDVDSERCSACAADFILQQLARLGLCPNELPLRQSQRGAVYQQALDALISKGLAYPCACSRREIAAVHASAGRFATPHQPLPYPGTCRYGAPDCSANAWRFFSEKYVVNRPSTFNGRSESASLFIAKSTVHWQDRRLGPQAQNVMAGVGDFILRRADGRWAYQLAVVVDDAAQGTTHVVRGADLADNTPRQLLLQAALGIPMPQYLHTPLVLGSDGAKLSKQHGAPALDLSDPLVPLQAAATVLGLAPVLGKVSVSEALTHWVAMWRCLYNHDSD